jgi:hypothetical protein
MSKKALNHASDLLKLEENQSMTPIICPLWKEEGSHYLSASTSSNPIKVGELDFTGKYV